MEEALQWWYQKGLRQLESEANLIREQLLQESLAMRRSLELSSSKSNESLRSSRQKCVAQLENFHSTLKELSDRLCPPYINEGLPFALHYLTERWQKRLPNCRFELSLPQNWRSPTSTDSLVILNILEDLLRIKEAKTLFNNLIFIALKQDSSNFNSNNQLKVMFLEEKTSNSTVNNDRTELEYLQQTFEGLTSGSCSNVSTEDRDVWLFEW